MQVEADANERVVIEFEPLDVENAEKLTLDLYGSDGSEDLKRTFAISGEVRTTPPPPASPITEYYPAAPPADHHTRRSRQALDGLRLMAAQRRKGRISRVFPRALECHIQAHEYGSAN